MGFPCFEMEFSTVLSALKMELSALFPRLFPRYFRVFPRFPRFSAVSALGIRFAGLWNGTVPFYKWANYKGANLGEVKYRGKRANRGNRGKPRKTAQTAEIHGNNGNCGNPRIRAWGQLGVRNLLLQVRCQLKCGKVWGANWNEERCGVPFQIRKL